MKCAKCGGNMSELYPDQSAGVYFVSKIYCLKCDVIDKDRGVTLKSVLDKYELLPWQREWIESAMGCKKLIVYKGRASGWSYMLKIYEDIMKIQPPRKEQP